MRYCLNIKGVNPHTFALSYQKNNQFSAKSKIFVLFSAKNTGAHEKSESRIFIRLLFYSVHLSVVYPVFISASAYNFVLPEEKRNAPYSRKCYYYIQNSAHNTCTSAECPNPNRPTSPQLIPPTSNIKSAILSSIVALPSFR